MNDQVDVFENLGSGDIRSIIDQLLVLLWDPTANLPAALLLYSVIALVLLIVVIIVIMVIISMPDDDELIAHAPADSKPRAAATTTQAPAAPARSRLMVAAVVTSLLLVAWFAAGYSTSRTPVCTGCHVATPHATEEDAGDPHASTACVACHEPGGVPGRYVSNVPFRLAHFIDGLMGASVQEEYGRVTQSACVACHEAGIADVTLNEARGLRMSHAEPLAASATCLDCHTIRDGVVSTHNAGMNPCLQCHDSELASSACSTCHDRQAAAAARARTTSFATAQVAEVRCGGCHDEQRQCDPCHGVRLPHDREFMAYAHARAAAVDYWFGDGSTCAGSECHTPTRRSCQRCHGSLLGTGHGAGLAEWHQNSTDFNCNRCHQRWAFSPQRDFCDDVCHTEAAMSYSPR